MLHYPRLKYCYQAEFLGNDRVLMLSEKKNTLLSGKLYTLVLAEIQTGYLSTEELVGRLEGACSAAEVIYALKILHKEGYLTESTPAVSPELCAYWNSLGLDVNTLLNVLEERSIAIESIGTLATEPFLQVLHANGVKIHSKGALRVVVTDDYDCQELQTINREALETEQPWMLIKPTGVEMWIGPLFIPRTTGCWTCLAHRLRNNRQMNTLYKAQRQTAENPPMPVAFSPMSIQTAANLAAIEIVKWLYFRKNETVEGRIVSLDTSRFMIRSHVLVKRPQCEICGEATRENRLPAAIDLRKKSSYCLSTQGGYREVPIEDTIEHYQHHVSPITGVVQTLEPYLPEQGSPVHNYVSGYNTALRSKSVLWLQHHLRGSNVGKGRTATQAKAGALCEAIERYSSTYQGDEPYIISSLEKLSATGIHPNACMNYSAQQYRNRERLNAGCTKFYFMVPVPFDESLSMHWTPVYSLTEQVVKYLPSCFCYNQYPAGEESSLFCYPDTNGNAAGNSVEEAILHGFLELVERDSAALWWYNMLKKPEVNFLSFHEPYFIQLKEFYESLNRSLYVLDLTSDLQIPVFAAISHRLDDAKQDIIFAFGAHVEARIGIERALIELNQLLPIVNLTATERAAGNYRTNDSLFLEWLHSATRENHPYLMPSESVSPKTARDYPRLCAPNVYDSVMLCMEIAKKHGLEILVLDMTRADVGLCVVKVIVPGLRHFWRRLAPGRLYDVPVRMGWLAAPLIEEKMNSISIFI